MTERRGNRRLVEFGMIFPRKGGLMPGDCSSGVLDLSGG